VPLWLVFLRLLSVNNPNITLRAGIDFKVIRKLAAESCHLDGLTLTQAADIDARRGGYE